VRESSNCQVGVIHGRLTGSNAEKDSSPVAEQDDNQRANDIGRASVTHCTCSKAVLGCLSLALATRPGQGTAKKKKVKK
jgi:hypothetical protein